MRPQESGLRCAAEKNIGRWVSTMASPALTLEALSPTLFHRARSTLREASSKPQDTLPVPSIFPTRFPHCMLTCSWPPSPTYCSANPIDLTPALFPWLLIWFLPGIGCYLFLLQETENLTNSDLTKSDLRPYVYLVLT